MWNDRDLEEQYVPDHLINHHINIKPRENGLDHRHVIPSSYDHMESNHLMSHHGDIIDPMLSHIGDQETMLMSGPISSTETNQEDIKLPSRREKTSLLRMYAKKLGLNDRGCYIAIALSIFVFFLLIIIIALLVSWPASHLRYTGPLKFCNTPACLESAANLVEFRNISIQPCRDMYTYACGGWEQSRRIPEGRSSWSLLQEMEERASREKSRIVSMFSHKPSQYDSIEWKVQHFYESCKSLDYIESDKEKPLIKIVNNLGGWDVLRTFNLYNWDPHRVLRELHSEYMVNAFFQVDVVPDFRVPGQNIIRISPAGLGLPEKTFYQRFPNDSSIQAYQTFMKDSAQLFGAPSNEAYKFAIDIFNFEKRIAEITPGLDYLNDPMKVNNKMKVKELRTMSINIPWVEVLKACFPSAKISENTDVIVVSPQYAADIAVIMSTTDRASLNNYLIWQLVHTYMPYLSSTYTEVMNMYLKFQTGAQKPLQRWEFCYDVTQKFFGHLMDSIYYENQGMTDEREVAVHRMFSRIRDTVGHKVSGSREFDYFTRQNAIDKLHSMSIQVGTPDILRDRRFLKIMFKDMSVQNEDFFQNIQYGMHFLRKRQEHSLLSPGEETRWLSNLLEKKVTYSPSANKVVIPEYLLSEPLFHPRYPSNVNLGGLGVMIAEAVITGVAGTGSVFTPTGRILDGTYTGNFSLSRTEEANKPLLRIAGCLSNRWTGLGLDTPDQLEKCAVSSAISVAGLEAAYGALTESLLVEGGELLPALETLDPQSVFILQYSQTFCSLSSLQQRDLDRTLNHELLGREKLKGVLSQFSEFAHYYFCSESSDESCGSVF